MAATYTVKQVAEILGYSTNSIYSFLKEKRIKGIRVGTGRFRIPQSELNRLLLISKGQAGGKQEGNIVPVTGTLIASDSGIITPHESAPPFSLSLLGWVHTVTANIFDWFIGIGAFVAGIAMFLFDQAFDLVNMGSFMLIVPVARILLIGGGLGVLLANFAYDSHKIWHRVFHGVIALGFIGLTVFLLVTRDIDGAAVYGVLAVVIVLTVVVRLGKILPFVLYLTLLAAVAPVVAFIAPQDFHIISVANALTVTPLIMGIGLSCLGFGFILFLWLGLYRKKSLFWLCSYAATIVYFVLAFWFAHDQFWSRAFFFMIIALTCMYLPSWGDLTLSHNRKAHTLAIGVFISILAVILIGITVVYVTQLNVIATVERENVQKVDYIRIALESDILSVKSTVTTASINPNLVAAVEKKDISSLTDLSRIIFDSSQSIQRIFILDANGYTLFEYPLGQISETDLSFRDYFIRARDTGMLYISDIFEAVGTSHRKVVTISAPILTPDKKFVGVLAESLDLPSISARLQKIAVVDRGEYVVVIDTHGKRIMHPEASLIGTDTEVTDPTRLGLVGHTGAAEGNTYDGIHSLIAYAPINSLHWAVALKAPFADVYALSNTANVFVAGLVIGFIVIAVLIFQLNYIFKYKSENDGGSP
jgi:excisionase family DNA binding protein